MKKTISIISENEAEYSTEKVMDWILFKNHQVRRLNGVDILKNNFFIKIDKNNDVQSSGFLTLDKKVWYRRWIHFYYYDYLGNQINGKTFNDIRNFLLAEFNQITSFLFKLNQDKEWVDWHNDTKLNKLNILNLASKAEIKIPKTVVTNNKKDLYKCFEAEDKIITKTIGNITPIDFQDDNYSFFMETKLIAIEELEEKFYPSLFQEYINKKYEIRVFYLDGKMYSMAIFSQSNPKTKIDFRNYDQQKPNRVVPIDLPFDLREKLKKLVKSINLKHCSIDLIKNTENEYIFLEINSVGQFGMVSFPCNYYLEEKIANLLINEKNEENK